MSSRAPKSATFIANGAKHKLNGASRHQRAAFLRERASHATFASVTRKARSCSSARMFLWAMRAVTGTAVSIRRLPPERRMAAVRVSGQFVDRSEEHTSELQSLMRISYAVFCSKTKKKE